MVIGISWSVKSKFKLPWNYAIVGQRKIMHCFYDMNCLIWEAKMGSAIMTNESKRMDWHLIWTAGTVIVALGALIVGCFRSLSYDIKQIDQRLSKLEGAFEERGRWESRRERT